VRLVASDFWGHVPPHFWGTPQNLKADVQMPRSSMKETWFFLWVGYGEWTIHSRGSLSMKEIDTSRISIGLRIYRQVPIYTPNIVLPLSFPILLFTFADSPLLM
jgi:hypothetical protein